jgi:hypothetical protein
MERITSSVRQVCIAKAGSTFRAWKPARRKTPPRGATGADIESDAGCQKGDESGGGRKRLERLARFLERDYESAARSLREGMAEVFTPQRLKLPPSLYERLATTNLIENPHSGVAHRTAHVKYWRDQGMVERRVASRRRK